MPISTENNNNTKKWKKKDSESGDRKLTIIIVFAVVQISKKNPKESFLDEAKIYVHFLLVCKEKLLHVSVGQHFWANLALLIFIKYYAVSIMMCVLMVRMCLLAPLMNALFKLKLLIKPSEFCAVAIGANEKRRKKRRRIKKNLVFFSGRVATRILNTKTNQMKSNAHLDEMRKESDKRVRSARVCVCSHSGTHKTSTD